MADENLLEQAATASQGMIAGSGVGGQGQQPMTTFGPTPVVQPPPIPRFQPPPSQGGRPTSFASTGSRKRADKQALFSGVANFVKAGADYIQANKMRGLSLDIEHLMGAQQGIEEAKQALQQNPNDPKAKEALETNTSILNNLTKDPKKAKLFQKAFNIDLFGDGKNKKENQALVEAWKQYQQKQQAGDKTALNPIASRMMQQQPQREQLSPEAAQQAAAIKAGLVPKAGELLKAQVDIYKELKTVKSQEERTAVIDRAAKLRAITERYRADKYIDAINIKVLGMKDAMEIRSRAEVYKADSISKDWDKRIAAMTNIASNKDLNEKTKTIFGSLSKDAGTYLGQLKTLVEENTKLQTELDKKGSTVIGGIKFSAATETDAKLMRQKIGQNNAAMKDAQGNLADVQKQLHTLQQMGIVSMDGENQTDTGESEVNVNDDEVPEE